MHVRARTQRWFTVVCAALVAFAVAVGACATTPDVRVESDGAPSSLPGGGSSSTAPGTALVWKRCGTSIECTQLTVPVDRANPAGATISLAINRHKANKSSQRIGVMLVNPGGPGVGGRYLVEQADSFFSPQLLDRFDVVAWDPRGTGASSPVQCVTNLDDFFSLDPTPDSSAEKDALLEAARAFQSNCQERNREFLRHISTQDTARDMEAIRVALGEDKISYFGFSYGSTLGATYATMFPERVRAMALDGAVDPNATIEATTLQQAKGLERALSAFFDDCASNSRCAFYNKGNPGTAFDALMASLDAEPLRTRDPKRPPVGQGVAYIAVLQALYATELWPDLAKALGEAQKGNGQLLLAMYDSYLERRSDGTWSHSIDALIAINCVDSPGPQDIATLDRISDRAADIAPRLGRALASGYTCLGWPYASPPLKIDAKGAGPIVVVGNTGDPVTPIEATEAMARSLEKGFLVRFEGQGHTSYIEKNKCVTGLVDAYLVDLKVPGDKTTCR